MSLFDVLACPVCHSSVRLESRGLRVACDGCPQTYPVRDGIPIMLVEPERAMVSHESELAARPGYSRWKERVVLKSLTDAQIALDFGAGRQTLDDPRIIRMDLVFDPLLDVVGDVHQLPFKSDSLDFVFGGAVMEHLPHPRQAADEMYRVLRPGGYVYADWNFHGVDQTFERFTVIDRGVAPFHGPAFAIRSVLGTYLEVFKPTQRLEREFVDLLHRVLWHPLDEFDERIEPADRHRVAASVYFFGLKQPNGGEHLIPAPVVEAYQSSEDLQRRFAKMLDLSVPENIMLWAKRDGVHQYPAIREHFEGLAQFSKRGRQEQMNEPRALDALPAVLLDRPDTPLDDDARRYSLSFSRPIWSRLADAWQEAGVSGLVRCFWSSLKHRCKLIVLWFQRDSVVRS